MRLVLDAAAGVRQVLSRKRPRLLTHSSLQLLMPEHCMDEALRTLRARIDGRAAAGFLDPASAAVVRTEGEAALSAAVELVPALVYASYEADAQQRLESHCAFDDWPAVALALALAGGADGLWTDDRDYFGSGIAVWSTDALRRVLFNISWGVVVEATDPSTPRS